jgi:hypothetical protein
MPVQVHSRVPVQAHSKVPVRVPGSTQVQARSRARAAGNHNPKPCGLAIEPANHRHHNDFGHRKHFHHHIQLRRSRFHHTFAPSTARRVRRHRRSYRHTQRCHHIVVQGQMRLPLPDLRSKARPSQQCPLPIVDSSYKNSKRSKSQFTAQPLGRLRGISARPITVINFRKSAKLSEHAMVAD